MLTYRIRPREFKLESVEPLQFPAEVVIRCHFEPRQPFGGVVDGGRTASKDTPASAYFNANTGQHHIEPKPPFEAVDVVIEYPNQTVEQVGSVFTMKRRVESVDELSDAVDSLYFALPAVYNAQLADPPIISRIDGVIGDRQFRWELRGWAMGFDITTNENQQGRLVKAFDTIDVLSDTAHRRVFAALHYFHVACRLERVSGTPGEFLAEALLNYAKVLEVLFPPTAGLQSRESIRSGLRQLDFAHEDIESDYMPAIALRNEVDVAHVDLTLFTPDHLQALHRYVGRAERTFRQLLARVTDRLISGSFRIRPWVPHGVDKRSRAVLDRLKASMDRLGDRAVEQTLKLL
jgi:hypothetical protein